MLIDFHSHCFPDNIAKKAIGRLSEIAGIEPCTDGTIKSTLERMKEDNVDISVICNIATNPRQQSKVNDFAMSVNDLCPKLIALGSVHPDSDTIRAELRQLCDHDIKGIKIHPEYTDYYIDAPEWKPVFSACAELGIFIVTHAGFDFISPDRIAVTPRRLAAVLAEYSGLRIIAAHLGGNHMWEDVLRYLIGKDVYFDTALIAREGIAPDIAKKIILSHDPEKILFGSDLPWSAPAHEAAFIKSLELGATLEEKIFYKNAEELLLG